MIMKFLKKTPAGMMVVPMLLGAFINTFFPQVTGIGSFTTAIFTSAGANAAIGIQLFCLGTTLRFREIGGVVKRGGVLLVAGQGDVSAATKAGQAWASSAVPRACWV